MTSARLPTKESRQRMAADSLLRIQGENKTADLLNKAGIGPEALGKSLEEVLDDLVAYAEIQGMELYDALEEFISLQASTSQIQTELTEPETQRVQVLTEQAETAKQSAKTKGNKLMHSLGAVASWIRNIPGRLREGAAEGKRISEIKKALPVQAILTIGTDQIAGKPDFQAKLTVSNRDKEGIEMLLGEQTIFVPYSDIRLDTDPKTLALLLNFSTSPVKFEIKNIQITEQANKRFNKLVDSFNINLNPAEVEAILESLSNPQDPNYINRALLSTEQQTKYEILEKSCYVLAIRNFLQNSKLTVREMQDFLNNLEATGPESVLKNVELLKLIEDLKTELTRKIEQETPPGSISGTLESRRGGRVGADEDAIAGVDETGNFRFIPAEIGFNPLQPGKHVALERRRELLAEFLGTSVEDITTSEQLINDLIKTGKIAGLQIVADGMGGHGSGELASNLAAYTLIKVLGIALSYEEEVDLQTVTAAAKDAKNAIVTTFQALIKTGKIPSDGGTTLNFSVVLPSGRTLVGSTGDSRAYVVRAGGKIELLTRDQSLVARLMEVDQIETDTQILTHPQRSALLSTVDKDPTNFNLQIVEAKLASGDRLINACDGMWEDIQPQFTDLFAEWWCNNQIPQLNQAQYQKSNDVWRGHLLIKYLCYRHKLGIDAGEAKPAFVAALQATSPETLQQEFAALSQEELRAVLMYYNGRISNDNISVAIAEYTGDTSKELEEDLVANLKVRLINLIPEDRPHYLESLLKSIQEAGTSGIYSSSEIVAGSPEIIREICLAVPNIREIVLNNLVSAESVAEFAALCPNLVSLSLSGFDIHNYTANIIQAAPSLVRLNLNIPSLTDFDGQRCQEILEAIGNRPDFTVTLNGQNTNILEEIRQRGQRFQFESAAGPLTDERSRTPEGRIRQVLNGNEATAQQVFSAVEQAMINPVLDLSFLNDAEVTADLIRAIAVLTKSRSQTVTIINFGGLRHFSVEMAAALPPAAAIYLEIPESEITEVVIRTLRSKQSDAFKVYFSGGFASLETLSIFKQIDTLKIDDQTKISLKTAIKESNTTGQVTKLDLGSLTTLTPEVVDFLSTLKCQAITLPGIKLEDISIEHLRKLIGILSGEAPTISFKNGTKFRSDLNKYLNPKT